jgi:uncharacterized protein (TIGR02145 family)
MRKKRRISISIVIMIAMLPIITSSCKKDQAGIPTLTTTAVTNITQNTATSGGNITDDGGAAITIQGVCWSTNQSPTIADNKTTGSTGLGTFTSNITGLENDITYYVRAYATNRAGTGYGNSVSFIAGTVTDIDGNLYHTVTIGTQVWMVQNLRTSRYNDSTAIPLVTDDAAWAALTTPAHCFYNNDNESFMNSYGALYNWYAVSTGKLCPSGWHVPTDNEWYTLTTFLGGTEVAGGKLKESGTSHWKSPNSGADNSSGFTGLPGDFRNSSLHNGLFYSIGNHGAWWSSSEGVSNSGYAWRVGYDVSSVYIGDFSADLGLSVRCIKD